MLFLTSRSDSLIFYSILLFTLFLQFVHGLLCYKDGAEIRNDSADACYLSANGSQNFEAEVFQCGYKQPRSYCCSEWACNNVNYANVQNDPNVFKCPSFDGTDAFLREEYQSRANIEALNKQPDKFVYCEDGCKRKIIGHSYYLSCSDSIWDVCKGSDKNYKLDENKCTFEADGSEACCCNSTECFGKNWPPMTPFLENILSKFTTSTEPPSTTRPTRRPRPVRTTATIPTTTINVNETNSTTIDANFLGNSTVSLTVSSNETSTSSTTVPGYIKPVEYGDEDEEPIGERDREEYYDDESEKTEDSATVPVAVAWILLIITFL